MGYPVQIKTAAVFFSAGIGDALLLTPLLKQLKRDSYRITGIFTSPYGLHELYELTDLLDTKIVVLTKPRLVWFITRYRFTRFDVAFVNSFATNKRNLLAAHQTALEVRTNKEVIFKNRTLRGVRYSAPVEGIHDGEQNLRLLKPGQAVTEDDFRLSFRNKPIYFQLPEHYFVLQAGAGNNETPYKIWDSANWRTVIETVHQQFPHVKFVLLGDRNELQIGEQLQHPAIIDLTGKTNLQEVVAILKGSKGLIGGDSGLMHLAVTLNKPTFTIWGASSEKLYSYAAFNAQKHVVIYNSDIHCRPCSAWIGANQSRVSDPLACPDFACLKGIAPGAVSGKLSVFLSQYAQ